MRKIISKILTATFIVCFAYIGSTIEFKDASPKPVIVNDIIKKTPIMNETINKNETQDTVQQPEPPPKPVTVEFYKEPEFYFKSTVGGVFGYILKHVLDFITAGIKLVIGKMS